MATQKINSVLKFAFGEILGHIDLTADALDHAKKHAADHYREQEEIDFSGHPVDLASLPQWAKEHSAWVPAAQLRGLGYVLGEDRTGDGLVATVGVDQHIDATYGHSLCLVLHSDGFTFRQGRQSHKPAAGDWFIFDDHAMHGVRESCNSTTFVALVLPLLSV